MKFFKTIDIAILISLTILLVYDYFPNIPLQNIISKNVLILLMVALFLLSLLFKRYRNSNNLETFKWQLFTTVYLVFLMVLLTILGGQSTCGISFKNVFFWIALSISCLQMFFQLKKEKQSDI